MRLILALGLLMTLCASANAAARHRRHHFIAHHDQRVVRREVFSAWAYAPYREPLHFDSTPGYNDLSQLPFIPMN
jgi:hypothetical protein